jgi:hypothetical protein
VGRCRRGARRPGRRPRGALRLRHGEAVASNWRSSVQREALRLAASGSTWARSGPERARSGGGRRGGGPGFSSVVTVVFGCHGASSGSSRAALRLAALARSAGWPGQAIWSLGFFGFVGGHSGCPAGATASVWSVRQLVARMPRRRSRSIDSFSATVWCCCRGGRCRG